MPVLAVSNVADVAIAAVAAIPAVLTVLVSTRQQNKKLDKVTDSVATSNGKTTGQYIEEVWHKFDNLELGQTRLYRQILDHTNQDAVNFAAIEDRLHNIDRKLEGDES